MKENALGSSLSKKIAIWSFVFAAVLMGDAAKADIILADDLIGVDKTNSTATIESWDTEVNVTAGTTFSAVDQGGTPVNFFKVRPDDLDVDTTAGGAGLGWDVSFSLALNLGAAEMQLNSVDLSGYLINSSGALRSTTSDRTWTLTVTGDGSYGTHSASATSTYSPTGTTQIDLSGLPPLAGSENYTVTLGVRYVSGTSTYQALSSISLDGSVVFPAGTVIVIR